MKKKEFFAGILCGALIFGGGSAAAAGLTAQPSRQSFYVDGRQVELEAYAISGHNYVQLRDIGRAVDFGVCYDESGDRVVIDSASPYVEEPRPGGTAASKSDAPFRPLAGEVVPLDDGSTFTVTEAKPEEPSLPAPACDWSPFPALELPEARSGAWADGSVAIPNFYETRRMQYTLYNAVPSCAELWEGGRLKRSAGGAPVFRLQLGFEDSSGIQTFWPWREEQLTQVFYSAPMAKFSVLAWDIYYHGKFLYTRYDVQGK